jgi:hypothetical protein
VTVIGVFGTLLLNISLAALARYRLLVVSTYLGSNSIVSIYRFVAQSVKASRADPRHELRM